MTGKNRVINIVDQLSSVNYGIWHAAIASSEALFKNHGVKSILVAPDSDFKFDGDKFPFIQVERVSNLGKEGAKIFLKQFDPSQTVVASHGAWQFPTRWGKWAKDLGFTWIYTPHGMLEPWSMSQKKIKKWLYFNLIESRLVQNADFIRAVGKPEAENLKRSFKNVKLIPNGVYPSDISPIEKPKKPIQILYLARLHSKKGVVPLLHGWKASALDKNSNYLLTIAGTDDGEEQKVKSFLIENKGINARFIGPQFGEEKTDLLSKSHFYILPSLSEGFPTSVVESMAAGMVPIITKGCNFPEALENGLAIETSQTIEDICQTLNTLLSISEVERIEMAIKAQDFIQQNYVWDKIALLQFELMFQG